jgi:hypothetical protein
MNLRVTPWSQLSEADYIAEVLREADNDELTQSFSDLQTSPSRISYFGSSPYSEHVFVSPSSTRNTLQIDELLQQAEVDRDHRNAAICIIENVSPAYIGVLGRSWEIDPSFFANHAKHSDKDQFWDRPVRWSWVPDDQDPSIMSKQPYVHLDGMFEYHHLDSMQEASKLGHFPNTFPRDCFKQWKYPVQSNTRISYCRALPNLCELDPLPMESRK